MRIAPFSTSGRFWRGNLHTHSTRSDGALSPEQVIAAYKRAGYDFIALSDHFLARYDWPITDTRAIRANNFTTLIGAELHAMGTEVGELWHILAVGLPLDFPAARPGETGPQLAQRARDAGAFVAIAHPAWSQLRIGDGRALAAAHAVEVYNHGSAVETDRGDGFYLLDQLCNEGRRLSAIATDDAHFRHGDHDAFGGFVEVKAESLAPEALLAALKAGQFYASQGPRLLDVDVRRDEVTVACSPVDAIALVTGTSRAISRIGRQMTGATLEVAAAAQRAWSEAAAMAWFRIVVIDAAGRRAWTNPIWVDQLED
ncbi:MAG: CehA/McbA family metallohydrolase [Pseudomonadota bacterium]|nr:CehA/McbA family metallohydrolase [Pseudomonadota bacterium]